LFREYFKFTPGRRGVSDEAEGDVFESCSANDCPSAAAGPAERWVFVDVEGDGDGIVWESEMLVGGGGNAEAKMDR
jgi:hypothetical protein